MKRGEVYHVDLSHGRYGHEEKGFRYGIIFSNNVFNGTMSWGTVIIVPTSASPTQAQRNYGVILPAGSGGLPVECVALCHQITTIDRRRLGALCGTLPVTLLDRVDQEVRTILYL